MRNFCLIIIAAVGLVVMACTPAAAPVSISEKPISINGIKQPGVPPKPIPDMMWTGMDGSRQRIADHRDKVLILDFWATYCGPCRDEIPHLNSLQAKFGDRLQVVGLNVGGDDDKPKIPAFANELKVSYPIAFPEEALMSYISADDTRIPQTAVFDKRGNLVVKVIGFDDSVKNQIDRAVESVIDQ